MVTLGTLEIERKEPCGCPPFLFSAYFLPMPQSSTASPKLPPGISAEQAQMESERMQDVVLLVEGLLRQEEATLGMIVECLYDIGSVRLIDKKLQSRPLNSLSKSIAGFSKPVVRMVALRWLKKNCPELLANWLYSKVQFNEEPPPPTPKVDTPQPATSEVTTQAPAAQPPVIQDTAAQPTQQSKQQPAPQSAQESVPQSTQQSAPQSTQQSAPQTEAAAASDLTIRPAPTEAGENGASVLANNPNGNNLGIPSETTGGIVLQPLPLVIPASDASALEVPGLAVPASDFPVSNFSVSDFPASETEADALPLALAVEQIALEQAGAELTLPQQGNGAIAPSPISPSAPASVLANGQGLKGSGTSNEGWGGALASVPAANLAAGSLKDSERAIAQIQYRDSEIQRLRTHNQILFGVVVASAIALGAALMVPNCAINAGGSGEAATVQTPE